MSIGVHASAFTPVHAARSGATQSLHDWPFSVGKPRPMHKRAAAMHRRRPLADAHASSRRGTHPNEAHAPRVHHNGAAARITYLARSRAAA
jgi:hypothetical protein